MERLALVDKLEARRLLSTTMLSIGDASLVEGDGGASSMVFAVTRGGDLSRPVSVAYATVDGTAKAGTDYQARSGTLTLAAGQSSAVILVPVFANTMYQVDRGFTLQLSADFGWMFTTGGNTATGGNPSSVAAGDFNGDGKTDLAVANQQSNTVSVLAGLGNGSFAAGAVYAAGIGPASVAVGDFNGDGKPDLAVAGSGSRSVSVLAGNGDATFGLTQNYTVGNHPAHVLAGDFNADAKLDIVAVNELGDSVSLLTGNGDGTFQTAMERSAGSRPVSVATGDFDGDGKADLAVAAGASNSVSVLRGNGDGTFAPAQSYAVGSGPVSVATGDFNSDGKADLAVANSISNSISVLINNGGTFASAVDHPAGAWPGMVAVADLDNDGWADLVAANSGDDTLAVLAGNGDGTFRRMEKYPAGSTPVSAVAGDFNGDSKADMAVVNYYGNNLSVLLNTGDSVVLTRATAAGTVIEDDAVATMSILAGDNQAAMPGDAFPALLSVRVANARGAGVLGVPVAFAAPAGGASGLFGGGGSSVTVFSDASGAATAPAYTANALMGSYSVHAAVGGVAVDFHMTNLNPPPVVRDLAAELSEGATYVLAATIFDSGFSDLDGESLQSVKITSLPGHGVLSVHGSVVGAGQVVARTDASGLVYSPEADFTGTDAFAWNAFDGSAFALADAQMVLTVTPVVHLSISSASLVEGDSGTANMVFTVTRSGGLAQPASVDYTTSPGTALAFVDYQPVSGTVNFAANQTTASISVPVIGNAVYQTNRTFEVRIFNGWVPLLGPVNSTSAGVATRSVAAGDFNGDGRVDLAVAGGTAAVRIFLGKAGGGFQAGQGYVVGGGAQAVSAADFDGDGKTDLAVALGNAAVGVLPGNGDGTFRAAQSYAAGNSPVNVRATDLNGDGRPDLAVANQQGASVSVLLCKPDGTFQAAVNYAAGSNPAYLVSGDFNGDGRTDLAVANSAAAGAINLLAGKGDGTFLAATSAAVAGNMLSVAAGDFNGDGKADLATTNSGAGTVAVLLSRGDGTFQPAQGYAAGSDARYVAAGDMNGDGREDLVVANNLGSSVTVVPGKGDGTFASVRSYPCGGAPTFVAVGYLPATGPVVAVGSSSQSTAGALSRLANAVFVGGPASGRILDNDAAASMASGGGGGQSALLGAALGTLMAVVVRNSSGRAVQGIPVLFSAPASGPGGSFGGNAQLLLSTDASGRATAGTFTTNTLSGAYTVTASASGVAPVTFNLTNTYPPGLIAGPGAVISITGPVGAQMLEVSAGTVTLTADISATLPGYTLRVSGSGVVVIDATQHIGSLVETGGGTVRVGFGGNITLFVEGLLIAAGASLDLGDNNLILSYTTSSPIDTVRQYIQTGRLFTSASQGNGGDGYTLAQVDNAAIRQTAWGGVAISDGANFGQVMVKRTWAGDSDIDGVVTQADMQNVIAGMGHSGMQWLDGDTNHDGTVAADDLATVRANLGAGFSGPAGGRLPPGMAAGIGAAISITGAVGAQVVEVSAGTVTLSLDIAGTLPNWKLRVTGTGRVIIRATQRIAGLAVEVGAAVKVALGAGSALFLGGLLMDTGSSLDLADNDLILSYGSASPIDTVRQDIQAGRLFTSASSGGNGHAYTLAQVDNAAIRQARWSNMTIGDGVDFKQVMVKRAYVGDTSIDGVVAHADYLNIVANMGRAGAQWLDGDINHDGVVSIDDLAAVSANLGAGGSGGNLLATASTFRISKGILPAWIVTSPQPSAGAGKSPSKWTSRALSRSWDRRSTAGQRHPSANSFRTRMMP